MELAPGALATGLAAPSLQLIDRPFDHRLIGETRFDQSPDLAGKANEGLPELAELLSLFFILYVQILYSIQIFEKKSRKKRGHQKTFLGEMEETLVVVSIAVYGGLKGGRLIPSRGGSLVSELQGETFTKRRTTAEERASTHCSTEYFQRSQKGTDTFLKIYRILLKRTLRSVWVPSYR